MPRYIVQSSNIEAVGYDPSTMCLEVEFKSGAVYEYHCVPNEIATGLAEADHPGQYLNSNIKGTFECKKVKDASPKAG